MKWNALQSIDWSEFETTADWVKLLNELLALVESADTAEKRELVADKLDEFADRSSSEDLATITKLDAAARKAARALRVLEMQQRVSELAAASADYHAAVKELTAASAGLKKEAALLRLEKFGAATTALTETIASLKNLSHVVSASDEKKLAGAIERAVKSAQELRSILEGSD
jgi:DNA-binding ferritin-like protein (Dps family)